jgi:hypothetical protein
MATKGKVTTFATKKKQKNKKTKIKIMDEGYPCTMRVLHK